MNVSKHETECLLIAYKRDSKILSRVEKYPEIFRTAVQRETQGGNKFRGNSLRKDGFKKFTFHESNCMEKKHVFYQEIFPSMITDI